MTRITFKRSEGGGIGLRFGATSQNDPLHVRPQLLAKHNLSPVPGKPLDCRAMLCRHRARGVEPRPDVSAVFESESQSQRGLPTNDGGSLSKRFLLGSFHCFHDDSLLPIDVVRQPRIDGEPTP